MSDKYKVKLEPWCKQQLNELLGKHQQPVAGLIIGQRRLYTYNVISFFHTKDEFKHIDASKENNVESKVQVKHSVTHGRSAEVENIVLAKEDVTHDRSAETEHIILAKEDVTHYRSTDVIVPEAIVGDDHRNPERDANFSAVEKSMTNDGAHYVVPADIVVDVHGNPERDANVRADIGITTDNCCVLTFETEKALLRKTTSPENHFDSIQIESVEVDMTKSKDDHVKRRGTKERTTKPTGENCKNKFKINKKAKKNSSTIELDILKTDSPNIPGPMQASALKSDQTKGKIYESIKFDEQIQKTIYNHALEVIHRLPGGFFIVGVFFVNNNKIPKKHSPKHLLQLQTVRYLVSQLYEYNWKYGAAAEYKDLPFLLLNHSRKKTRCEYFESKWYEPATISFKKVPTRFIQINIWLDHEFILSVASSKDESNPINKKLHEGLLTTVSELLMKDEYNTIFSHNGLKRESKTTIDKIFQAGQIFDVDLHNKDIGITVEYQTEDIEARRKTDNKTSLMPVGKISSHIYVTSKLTVAQLNCIVCTEIWRPLIARLRLLLDRALTVKDAMIDINKSPRRVSYKPFHGSNIEFSDTELVVDLSHEKAIEKAKQLFGFNLYKENIRTGEEPDWSCSNENVNDPEMQKDKGDAGPYTIAQQELCCTVLILVCIVFFVVFFITLVYIFKSTN